MDDCRTLFRKIKSALDDAEKERKKGNLGGASNHYSLAEDLLNENKRYLDYFDDADRATFQDFQILVAKEYEKIVSDFNALKTRTSENNSRDIDSKEDSNPEPDNLNNPARQNNPRNAPSGGGDESNSGNKGNNMADDKINTYAEDFFKRAKRRAEEKKYAEAAELGNIVLGMVKKTYPNQYNTYKLQVDNWNAHAYIHQKDSRKRATDIVSRVFYESGKDIYKFKVQMETEINNPTNLAIREILDAEASKIISKEEGFAKRFTLSDEIQKLVTEATNLADEAKQKKNPSKLERAIARLEQAKELCESGGPEYNKQLMEIRPLIERYRYDYDQIFKLFGITEEGRASPWALNKIKYRRDDIEVERDDFDALATKLKLHQIHGSEESRNDVKKFTNHMKSKYGDEWTKRLKDRYRNHSFSNLLADENTLDTMNPEELNEALKTATAEAEHSMRLADMMKGYGDKDGRHAQKARDTRDKFRGRAISGRKHWGEGGHWAVDAAEWVGFERNPIETLGNLAATIMTGWIVIKCIVGPILDVFEFFIPFINILRIPIYLIAIIILHPFMKTILHPIKRDLHFIAGDPYWYEKEKEDIEEEKTEEKKEEAEEELEEEKEKEAEKEEEKKIYPHETRGEGVAPANP